MKGLEQLRAIFGNPEPPPRVDQLQFDGGQDSLERIAAGNATALDFIDYLYDIRYVELQPDLFRWAFPLLLAYWRSELLSPTSSLIENFDACMGVPRFPTGRWLIEEMCSPEERSKIYEFIGGTVLEAMGLQKGLQVEGSRAGSYLWNHAWVEAGCWLPVMGEVLSRWWSSGLVGHRLCAVQWISALQYGMYDNPVFPPWTPDKGGGPPCHWSMGGLGTDCRWRDENLAALKNQLTMEATHRALERAVHGLASHPEYALARRVLDDWAGLAERTAKRIPLLLTLLSQGARAEYDRWEDYEDVRG